MREGEWEDSARRKQASGFEAGIRSLRLCIVVRERKVFRLL